MTIMRVTKRCSHFSARGSCRPASLLRIGGLFFPCSIGHGGFTADKREGDGATPSGLWPLRMVLYRPDRVSRPQTGLPTRALTPFDGWCDDPAAADYNCLIRHPCRHRAERLWRRDNLYDLLIVIGYNDDPPCANRGSAIFIHRARGNFAPTAGCLGLKAGDLDRLLRRIRCGDYLAITA